MNSYELGEVKLTLLKKLIDDPEIVALIDHNNECEYPDDLLYSHLFPFNRMPDTEQEVKTYVTVCADVPSIQANDLLRNLTITVRIFTHQNLMKVGGSNMTRIDLLAAKIDSLINESYDFGIGYVKLHSNTEMNLDASHMYRKLCFRTDSLNNQRCH